MIYPEKQLIGILERLLSDVEDEVVEFKEAKSSFSFNKLGSYFSALSNEANLKGQKEGWLVFGVVDKTHEIVGTHYYEEGNPLPGLKRDVAAHTNNGLGFKEIYEFKYKGKRIVMFQIPPAIPGIPTTWNKAAYSREGESLAPLPMNKMDEIIQQKGFDWSKLIVDEADFGDLDSQAIAKAREKFIEKNKNDLVKVDMIKGYSDKELLDKIGLTIKGKITHAALVMVGKQESYIYFDGFAPRITWTLYNGNGEAKSYEHFDMPMILAEESAMKVIRNVPYRYIPSQSTLFPQETYQYDSDLLRELIHNCIAHQDYTLRGKINIEEFEDRLVFINEGGFIPETIETAMEEGYKPPYYRNDFLCRAMINMNMIDTNSMGIPRMFMVQRNRYFPLPTYDLETYNRVSVTIYGKILDKNYTQLLYEDRTLDIQTVFLLDRVQKKLPITKDEYLCLKKHGLAEGRFPHIRISLAVASIVGKEVDYIRDKGLSKEKNEHLIINALETMEKCRVADLVKVLSGALPAYLDKKQQTKQVSNILQSMKKRGITEVEGTGHSARWHLCKQ